MKYLLFIILFLTGSELYSQGTWISSGSMSQNNEDYVYSMTTDEDGNMYASSFYVGIFKSTDGGNNWSPSGLNGKRVSFIACSPGGDLYALSKTVDFSYIHRSTDKGATWTEVDVRSFPLNYAGGGAVVFPQDGSIVAAYSVTVGPLIGNVGTFVFRSTDGGDTWNQTMRIDLGFVGGMIVTADNKILLGTSLSGVVYSVNNGLSFTNLTSFPPFFIKTIIKAPDNTVYVSDAFGLGRSTDNGASFTSVGTQNSTAYLRAAGVNANGDLFISMDDRKVFYSNNRGDSWTQINAGLPTDIFLYSFASHSGRMFGGTNGAGAFYFDQLTGISSNALEVTGYTLGQNYPNPFNPLTRISFGIPIPGFIELKLHNSSGQEVMTMISSNLSPGSYNAELNAGDLNSGVYFYSLIANGNIIETRKCVVVK